MSDVDPEVGEKRRKNHQSHGTKKRCQGKNSMNGEHKESILEKRKELPVYKARSEILFECRRHATLILVGETGSGKTTQVPQFLFDAGYAKHGMIAVTQPRRVAATSVARRVADEFGCRVGEEVGYTVRFEDSTSHSTKIKFMTDGMLLRELMLDGELRRYSTIVLDEAHERSLNTELLLALVKRLQKSRQESSFPLKVVIMSATLEAEAYSRFFLDCKIVKVPGRMYPVEVLYTPEPQPDFLDAAVVTCLQIHLEEPRGDVLCFLCGQDQIEDAAKVLQERSRALPPSCDKLMPCPLYAALPPSEQMHAFAPAPEGTRKIILATNIAESSITIDSIKYVVDNGLVKARIYDPKHDMESLHEELQNACIPISKAQAKQRAGRAGRVSSGKAYRLYTEAQFEELSAAAVPEIKRCRLSSMVLQLFVMGIDNLMEFEFMDTPPILLLTKALEQLFLLQALDKNKTLTDLGRKMAMLPLEPPYAKLLLSSSKFSCSEEILTIVAMLSVDSIFFNPAGKREEAARARHLISSADGDHMTYLKVYDGWLKSKKDREWCHQYFINSRNMKKVEDIRNQLQGYCKQGKIPLVSCEQELTAVARCLCTAFYSNTATIAPDGKSYRMEVTAQEVYLHPSSVLFGRRARSVVFDELVLTSKLYMRHCTVIDVGWLAELVPLLYKTAGKS
ncbi:hypothetical protein GUITHDRAFT_157138 [Guillardia theta CCMP2712]|uniref:RNA helicase n=1 Tax=Guillardia theta (strain CCMP2712) TaxID=905079 RepID=L1JU14_GUITC|nr:hypothetical protein GUITHDRAFT_157138 [Guillardia theta CCMP2712]EKX51695.1 hypothetical protein GUITHDRAFT_157138 [Guillardia theta CCMP2712]|eukprot:XP_005838675.1 hypothetical protein GUITHDRAFT_157138 [Guillardia theta CCMP2712]